MCNYARNIPPRRTPCVRGGRSMSDRRGQHKIMYFLLTKLGTGNARLALGHAFSKYSQVSKLSTQNTKWQVLHRNGPALCFNCDRRPVSSPLKRRQCHIARPQSLVDTVEADDDIFPTPVHGIKTLSKLMEDKFEMDPIFSVSSSCRSSSGLNQVELILNWPERQTFTACATQKKMALHTACHAALEWLYNNKHITKTIRPIMNYETSLLNKWHVNLNQSVVNEVDKVLQLYSKDVVPAISKFDRTWQFYSADMTHMHPTLGIPHPSEKDLEEWNKSMKAPKYRKLINLPIDDYREEILQAIKTNRVTVVKGATGCGKTTKVPQFILDEAIAEGRGAYCNIAVCLPRRLTAKETAKYVAYSRREPVGVSVGYNVRMERKCPSVLGGSITFMTGQKLALKFTSNQSLRGISHVVLDEVHLRDIGTDLVMNLLRRALQENKDLRVIIMSATIDSDPFQSYFSCSGTVPVIEVPGRIFPVTMHFLNNLPAELIPDTNNLNDTHPEIDFDLVRRVILWIHNTKPKGGILVFISGWSDITELTKLLPEEGLHVVPVHRRLRDHSAALRPTRMGLRKVILATNVAETSITFPDIVYVVDCGIHKTSQRKLLSRGRWSSEDMRSTWISKANVIQRRGRAGRVCPGESYHLFTEETFEKMNDHEMPQILNSSLESVVMMAKMVNPKTEATDLLGEFLQPPSPKDISETVTTLKEQSFLSHYDETPTALGVAAMRMSASLPSASAMIQSAVFRCVDTMVSVLSSEEEAPMGFGRASDERRVKISFHDSSDHLAKAKAIDSDLSCSPRTKYVKHFLKSMVKGQNDLLQNADLNEHDSEMLVKSILLNCFGSLLVRVKTPLSQYMIDTSGKSAIITSRSLNYHFDKMSFPFLMYLTTQGREKLIFVDDTSTISPLSVLLFFPMDFRTEEVDSETIEVKGWRNNHVSLVMTKETYARVKNLRRSLKDVLEYFVITEVMNFPDENYNLLCQFRSDLLQCINNLLSTELAQETDL